MNPVGLMPGRGAAADAMAKPGGPRGRKEGVAGERTGRAIGRGARQGTPRPGFWRGRGEGHSGGVPSGNGKRLRGSRGSRVSVPPSISFFGAAAGVAWPGRPGAGRQGLRHGVGSGAVTAGAPLPATRAVSRGMADSAPTALYTAPAGGLASASATAYSPRSAAAAVATPAASSAGGKLLGPPARYVSTMRSQKRRGASLQG